MVNKIRLWYIETNNLITNIQCGFSKVFHLQLFRFETFLKKAIVSYQHAIPIFKKKTIMFIPKGEFK